MSVVKVTEIMAQSEESWEDAAREAVGEATASFPNILSLRVKRLEAVVEDDEISFFRVKLKLAHLLENEEDNDPQGDEQSEDEEEEEVEDSAVSDDIGDEEEGDEDEDEEAEDHRPNYKRAERASSGEEDGDEAEQSYVDFIPSRKLAAQPNRDRRSSGGQGQKPSGSRERERSGGGREMSPAEKPAFFGGRGDDERSRGPARKRRPAKSR
jgi:flavin-binding protein dodecin